MNLETRFDVYEHNAPNRCLYEVHSKSSRTASITLISHVGYKKKLHVEKDEYSPCNVMQNYQY